ncbi:MAG: hypothetical protein ACRDPZ_11260 [Gaiellaceae bacterium]
MTRTISFIAVVGAALLVAAPGWGKGQPLATDPATEAQILRGQALDRHYGIGRFDVDPATEAQILRGQALDRHYGLGTFAVDPATEAQILRGEAPSSGSEVDWAQVGVVLGIGILLAAGLFVAMRFTRVGPLGH